MSKHCFEEIVSALSFHPSNPAASIEDKWALVQPFVTMLNSKWARLICSGYKDESTFAWYERGMPAVMKT